MLKDTCATIKEDFLYQVNLDHNDKIEAALICISLKYRNMKIRIFNNKNYSNFSCYDTISIDNMRKKVNALFELNIDIKDIRFILIINNNVNSNSYVLLITILI